MQLLANTTSPFVRIARVALMEKGFAIEPTIVDPWADDPRLRRANVSARVPTLVLDDGRALSESLLIVQWLEAARPAPQWPSLVGLDSDQVSTVLSRAGIALGAIEASVHTIITRKVTAPLLFDETPVGLRRQQEANCDLQGQSDVKPPVQQMFGEHGKTQGAKCKRNHALFGGAPDRMF
ncbi:MAG: glutathione S-transferase family protein [Betaproteobacteria bacterium]|nr:glutathione S-transferase family protein [Betaproteobacteria bacterium]